MSGANVNFNNAVTLLLQLIEVESIISAKMKAAHAAGGDIPDADMDDLFTKAADAHQGALGAIAAAKAAGR